MPASSRRTLWWIVALLAVVAAGVVAAAVVRASSSGPGSDVDGSSVVVIGDSLTVGAQQQGMAADADPAWEVTSFSGMTTEQGTDIAAERSFDGDELVVVALGTNDYLDDEATFAARIDDMMAALEGAGQVIWVNVDAGTDKLSPAADGVNAALVAAAARYDHLTVADWDAFVNAQADLDELRLGDEVHYSDAGYELRGRWMEDLVPS